MNKMTIHKYDQVKFKNKINKQVEQKQTHRYRGYFDTYQMGGNG